MAPAFSTIKALATRAHARTLPVAAKSARKLCSAAENDWMPVNMN